jgi:hypothetical protein
MLAYDYPLLSVFWTAIWIFLWIAWLMLLFRVIADVFRSRDMGGFAKAIWLIVVVIVPFLGVFVYVIARGDDMTKHAIEDAQARQQQFDAYVRETAGSGGTADELAKLAGLRDSGVLSAEEFEAQKARLLA